MEPTLNFAKHMEQVLNYSATNFIFSRFFSYVFAWKMFKIKLYSWFTNKLYFVNIKKIDIQFVLGKSFMKVHEIKVKYLFKIMFDSVKCFSHVCKFIQANK